MDTPDNVYERERELKSIQALQGYESSQVVRIHTMFVQFKYNFINDARRLIAICPKTTNPERCRALTKKLPALISKAQATKFPHPGFRTLVTRVGLALQEDADIATTDNAKLSAIALQVEQIYKNAWN